MTKKQFQSRFALTKIEETIRLFDSFGSVYQTSKQLVGVFEDIGPSENANTEDYRTLIAYIGATWAKMVHAIEIESNLPHGMELFDESREMVIVAMNRLRSQESHPTDSDLPGFVLARWHDISAKLFYFSGDHLEASKYWDIAEELIREFGIDFIAADVLSSRLRNKHELIRISTSNTSVEALSKRDEEYKESESASEKNEFELLVTRSKSALQAYTIPDSAEDAPGIAALQREVNDANWKDRGRLRGLANLYQNKGEFGKVRILATALRDELRLMQTYHSEAGKVWPAFLPERASRAAYLWKQVRDSEAWARGTIFARQHLARLDKEVYFRVADKENHDEKLWALYTGADELINVIDAIQDRDQAFCALRPNFAIRDIEQHGWTVKYALDILEELENYFDQHKNNVDAAWANRIEELDARMLDECVQMVRSHRKVIKISTFKTSFAAHYDRAFKRVYRHLTKRIEVEKSESKNQDFIREAILWVEESTCRDLLDAAAAAKGDAIATDATSAGSLGTHNELDGKKYQPAHEGTLLSGDYLLPCDEGAKTVLKALEESYSRFENHAMSTPQAPQFIAQDLLERVSKEATDRDCYFVRFAERSDSGIDAYVFAPSGTVTLTRLLGNESKTAIEEKRHLIDQLQSILQLGSNDFGDYKPLLEGLSKSIGKLLIQPILSLIEEGKELFLIPTSFLWQLPLHIGELKDGKKLFQRNNVYFSASLAALLDHKRLGVLDRKLRTKSFALLNSLNKGRSGKYEELGGQIASFLTKKRLKRNTFHLYTQMNFDSLQEAFRSAPEVLYYGCHGRTVRNEQGQHPILSFTGARGKPPNVQYPKSYITPYDIAIAPKLKNNVVTIFGACVTGQAADRDGGEVSGFLRASIAAGAGACLLTFWPVLQSQVNQQILLLIALLTAEGKTVGEAIIETQNPATTIANDWFSHACFACFV